MTEQRSQIDFSQDEAVMSTNDDATLSKRYAVSLGYWQDSYISYFCKQTIKKTPEISRGYFSRVCAVRRILEQFIKSHGCHCQILSLGAGNDTTFWNLSDSNIAPVKYIEVDFPSIVRQKVHILYGRHRDKLMSKITGKAEVIGAKMGIISDNYCLISGDLRKMDDVWSTLTSTCQIDVNLPTLVLSECVFMYMTSSDVDSVLTLLSQNLTSGYLLSYDMVNMADKFAEVMLTNLVGRHCVLHTADCISKDTQKKRFRRCGWSSCSVYDMNEVYNSFPQAERTRIEKLEFLDEVHLFSELMTHYCICVASNGSAPITLDLSTLSLAT